MDERTFGEKAVRLHLSFSGDEKIQEIKKAYAKVIDLLNDARTVAGQSEKWRELSIAITEAQKASLIAVYAITSGD